MSRLYTPKPLVFALMAAFAGVSLPVAASPLSMGDGDVCRNANPPKTFVTPPEVSGEGALPADTTRLIADKANGQSQVQVRADGRVIIERNTQTLNAEWAQYDQQTQIVTAGDDFTFADGFGRIAGKKLAYDMNNSTGVADDARFEQDNGKQRLQGTGEAVQMGGKNRYRLTNAHFNTCNPGDDSWYIRAGTVDADYDKKVGVAKNATFVFGGVPLFYTPWIDFPLDGNRKSGLMMPTVRSGSDGFELMLPYYLNLAPNYDATLRPHYISRRGLQLGGEFRYLQPDYSGVLAGQWMPHDKLSDERRNNRYLFDWTHKQKISNNWSAGIDFHQVSDDDYLRDFRSDSSSGTVNLNRQAWLAYSGSLLGGPLDANLSVQKYQTLASTTDYKDTPYATMPNLSANWSRWFGNHYQTTVFAQATRFESDSKQEGTRLVLYPTASAEFSNSWGYVRPKVGLHMTHYDLDAFDSLQKRTVDRVVPMFSVDSGATFERPFTFRSRPYVQTLEPRLFYTYIPGRGQNDLPLFDTSENSFTYDQLFRENRYSGQDRINAANFVTAALQTRFYDRKEGKEWFAAGVGQRFYFSRDDVLLDGSLVEDGRDRSDVLAFVRGNVNDKIRLEANWHYNGDLKATGSYDAGVRYMPAAGKSVSLRYKYGRYEKLYDDVYGKMRQVGVGVQWPVRNNYSVVAGQTYDLDNKKSLSTLLGLEYQSPCKCWSASVVGRRYVDGYNSTKTAYFFQLQLRDMAGIGNDPISQLRTQIPGYSSFY